MGILSDIATNKFMDQVYEYIQMRVEGYKYDDETLLNAPLPFLLAECMKGKRTNFKSAGLSH